MGRWEPDASSRLREAAMSLYVERGFHETTVADIAQRAGLTSRTFFRYFADKREVLFFGSAALQDQLVTALAAAPPSASPMDAIAAALDAAAHALGGRRDFSRQRHAVITATAELQERELMKMAALAAALAEGLRLRGVTKSEASLAAELGVGVLRVTYTDWVSGPANRSLPRRMRESLDQLSKLIAGSA